MNQDDMDERNSDIGMHEDEAESNDRGGWRSRSAPPAACAQLNPENNSEIEAFDIGLAATHSYLDKGMVSVRGRSVLETGWQGRIPVVAHHGCVFPGETVPMLVSNPEDTALVSQIIKRDRLFGLLCPDETGRGLSGYGVMCEVFEAGLSQSGGSGSSFISFKARANHRFRLLNVGKLSAAISNFHRMSYAEVRVLPEVATCDTLRAARLQSLDTLRAPRYIPQERGLQVRERARHARTMEAALTPWPRFVHDLFDYQWMRNSLEQYFKTIKIERLPQEPVSLSFWVASNLVLSPRDRLALFAVDNALLRLRIECEYVRRMGELCCSSCLATVSHEEYVLPMSSDGVHSNYVNPGGYVHDLVTVHSVTRVALNGSPSTEHSWFPGYTWIVVCCEECGAHLGWRFVSTKRTLRPYTFYGLCRNYIEPRSSREHAPDAELMDLIS